MSDLIEPIDVEIEQLDKVATSASTGVSGRREFFGNRVRKTKITLPAQVAFGNLEQVTKFSQLGSDEQIKGYMVLRFKDLGSTVLKRGDKVIKLGQIDTELFLVHSSGDPAAHFSSIGFTLLRMFFSDRQPVG